MTEVWIALTSPRDSYGFIEALALTSTIKINGLHNFVGFAFLG